MSAGCIKRFLSLSSLSYQKSVQSVNCLTALLSEFVFVLWKPKRFIHPNKISDMFLWYVFRYDICIYKNKPCGTLGKPSVHPSPYLSAYEIFIKFSLLLCS